MRKALVKLGTSTTEEGQKGLYIVRICGGVHSYMSHGFMLDEEHFGRRNMALLFLVPASTALHLVPEHASPHNLWRIVFSEDFLHKPKRLSSD